METKNTWGGKRPGAGRKKLETPNPNRKKFKTVSICGSEKEISALKRHAQEKEKSLSRYVVEELVSEEERKE